MAFRYVVVTLGTCLRYASFSFPFFFFCVQAYFSGYRWSLYTSCFVLVTTNISIFSYASVGRTWSSSELDLLKKVFFIKNLELEVLKYEKPGSKLVQALCFQRNKHVFRMCVFDAVRGGHAFVGDGGHGDHKCTRLNLPSEGCCSKENW